jgi:RNA polymerase sigma-70 factor (ECF subfamily)
MLFGCTKNPDEQKESDLLQAGYRYAFSLTHHDQDAEDLVQQAWIRVTRKYGPSLDQPLVFKTIRNLFYDQARRGKIVSFEILETDVPEAEPISRNSAQNHDLESLLGTLKSSEREVLFLNCVEGYTAEEISTLTQQPRGTILSMLSRAKNRLRNKFSKDQIKETRM